MGTTYEFAILDTEAGDDLRGAWPYVGALNAQLMRIAVAHGIGGYSKTRVAVRIDGEDVLTTRVDVHNPADLKFYSYHDVDFAAHVTRMLEWYKDQAANPANSYKITAENVSDIERALAACEASNLQELDRRAREEAAAAGPWDYPCD